MASFLFPQFIYILLITLLQHYNQCINSSLLYRSSLSFTPLFHLLENTTCFLGDRNVIFPPLFLYAHSLHMNHVISLFIQLATRLEESSKRVNDRDALLKLWGNDLPCKYKKNRLVTERKYRSDEILGGLDTDREIRRRLSKIRNLSIQTARHLMTLMFLLKLAIVMMILHPPILIV